MIAEMNFFPTTPLYPRDSGYASEPTESPELGLSFGRLDRGSAFNGCVKPATQRDKMQLRAFQVGTTDAL